MNVELGRSSLAEVEGYYRSPRFFGSEGEAPQETLIVDEPLEVTRSEYDQLKKIATRVVDFIDAYDLQANGIRFGANPETLKMCLTIDSFGGSTMRYGGLDLYQDPNLGFRVLEINPRAQAMGLQDFRQEFLGITDQPQILKHFSEWLDKKEYGRILVLGSRKNPFWRAYQRVTEKLNDFGREAIFCDAETFLQRYNDGFVPQMILKFCNNNVFLTGATSPELVRIISDNKIIIVNSLSSAYFGYRGFMEDLAQSEPQLVPGQVNFDDRVSDDMLQRYPWVKLEAAGKAYVANYSYFRRWGKDTIINLINRDIVSAEKNLESRQGGDALKLREVIEFMKGLPDQQIVWLGQSHVEPQTARLKIKREEIDLRILHRVYWFKKLDGEVVISLEGFGCTGEQFKRSKGKINAGSGFAVPMVIK